LLHRFFFSLFPFPPLPAGRGKTGKTKAAEQSIAALHTKPPEAKPDEKTKAAEQSTAALHTKSRTQSVGNLPKISVVTCSFNQGAFIGRTIDSVLAQDYPRLEHVVVDGMSADDTPAVLARYPHLRVIRESDRGQADALNKGFRAATGDVLCFLNSDDTLAPGALWRVAAEIDPSRGRHVVMGRCRFIDEHDRFLGREHPWAFHGHRRVLEVWKGHCLPQPAVFWTRQVWQRCGPLDEEEHLVLDYDLFCRFSRYYQFHLVDQVLANYRLHSRSKTCSADEQHVLKEAVRISRKYWGSPTRRLYWRLLASYARSRLDRRGRAHDLFQQGRQAWRDGRPLAALARVTGAALLGPDVVSAVALLPALARRAPGWFDRLGMARRFQTRRVHPSTRAWLAFDGMHADGWVGPVFAVPLRVGPGERRLHLEGSTDVGHLPEPLEVEAELDGRPLGRQHVGRRQDFVVTFPLGAVGPGLYRLRLVANAFVSHHAYRGTQDFRPLSFRLRQLRLTG
jgi:glycosyltransferase involved in cell wall biosynthesis